MNSASIQITTEFLVAKIEEMEKAREANMQGHRKIGKGRGDQLVLRSNDL